MPVNAEPCGVRSPLWVGLFGAGSIRMRSTNGAIESMTISYNTLEYRKLHNLYPRDGRLNKIERRMCERCLEKARSYRQDKRAQKLRNRRIAKQSVFQSIRVALTGSTISPPIIETLLLLGKESTIRRIRRCLDKGKEI